MANFWLLILITRIRNIVLTYNPVLYIADLSNRIVLNMAQNRCPLSAMDDTATMAPVASGKYTVDTSSTKYPWVSWKATNVAKLAADIVLRKFEMTDSSYSPVKKMAKEARTMNSRMRLPLTEKHCAVEVPPQSIVISSPLKQPTVKGDPDHISKTF